MKDRQLPDSFWQQPQRPSANIRCEVAATQRDVLFDTRTMYIRIPTPPDTNLLFSLFKILDQSAAMHAMVDNRSSHPATIGATGAIVKQRCRRSQRCCTNRRIQQKINQHHNNNNNQAPNMNLAAALTDAAHQPNEEDDEEDSTTVFGHHADVTGVDGTDEAFGNDRASNLRPQCFTDDDPYLCVGSQDRRVGNHRTQQERPERMRGCGDNFSDLLSDLVVNL